MRYTQIHNLALLSLSHSSAMDRSFCPFLSQDSSSRSYSSALDDRPHRCIPARQPFMRSPHFYDHSFRTTAALCCSAAARWPCVGQVCWLLQDRSDLVTQLPAGPAVSALKRPFCAAAAPCCSAAARQPCSECSQSWPSFKLVLDSSPRRSASLAAARPARSRCCPVRSCPALVRHRSVTPVIATTMAFLFPSSCCSCPPGANLRYYQV